jgi:hypothetical protein
VFDVMTLAATSEGAGGLTVSFGYAGQYFTTTTIAYNTSLANITAAFDAATGGIGNSAVTFANLYGTGVITATGTAGGIAAGPVTLTAKSPLEGPLVNLEMNITTPFTTTQPTLVHTTVGVGVQPTTPGGSALVLGTVDVPSTATTSANFVFTAYLKLTA